MGILVIVAFKIRKESVTQQFRPYSKDTVDYNDCDFHRNARTGGGHQKRKGNQKDYKHEQKNETKEAMVDVGTKQ